MSYSLDNLSFNMASNFFVLKHKDLDVAMVQVDQVTGTIEYVLEVYLPEELPLGYHTSDNQLIEWWKLRAIPDSRRGIQRVLSQVKEHTNLSLMLSAYGLGLTDHYWLQPIDKELYWKDLNFFENDFSDELGSLLTDSAKIDINANISKFSPSSSAIGEMKKKWVIDRAERYLMKVNANNFGQQAVNELIACRLHERLGWDDYVRYELETTKIDEEEVPCSLCALFTSTELELVSAYQLIRNHKVANDRSVYETLIQQAVLYGMDESIVRKHLEYTILTDFILTNTDRHFNNFGFLYDPMKHRLVSMAPIFDTGNALFYEEEFIPKDQHLLNVKVNSFYQKEVELLRLVTEKNLLDLKKLEGFAKEVESVLTSYTKMPKERAMQISETVTQKIEYLNLFQQGKKIWKKEAYW